MGVVVVAKEDRVAVAKQTKKSSYVATNTQEGKTRIASKKFSFQSLRGES